MDFELQKWIESTKSNSLQMTREIALQEVSEQSNTATWEAEKVFSLGMELLSSEFHEEKRLGILFLKSRGSEIGKTFLQRIEDCIDAHVYDWATCDTLSGAVLRKMIEADVEIVSLLEEWSFAENLWKRRACCVSFLSFAKKGEHAEAIERICDRSVRMNERFVQLGVGWLLRELSVFDREKVLAFLDSHAEWISREGLRYALEKMPSDIRKKAMDDHKQKNSKKVSKGE